MVSNGKPMASGSLLRIMITTRLYLDCRDTKPGNPAPLKFVINKNKVRALISLNIKIAPNNWDVGKQKATGEYASLNPLLTHKKSYVDTLIFQMESSGKLDGLSASEIKRAVEACLFGEEKTDVPEKDCFQACFRQFMNSRPSEGTRGVYAQTWRALERFCERKKINISNLMFENMTVKWLKEFDAFLSETSPSRNARNIHFRNIRAVFNDALDDEIISCYPFRKFKIKSEPTKKRSLDLEDLRLIFNMKTEPYAELYRDMFKLIFFLIGINTVDLHNLKSITRDGRVEYKRSKTKKEYSIKVEPEALEIIEKYKGKKGLLCIYDRWADHVEFRKKMNMALQKLGATRSGLGGKKSDGLFPDLTTYWARHTWATIAADLDITDSVISQALGHAPENRTTEIYIRRNRKKVDEANRKVIDWVLYGKK